MLEILVYYMMKCGMWDIYKIFMTFLFFHYLLNFSKLEKPIKNQSKNPLGLNDKNLELFHSDGRSRPDAICHNLSNSGEMCCKLRDRFPQPLLNLLSRESLRVADALRWHPNSRLINRY